METTNTMNRLDTLFSRKKGGILSVFFTAGFPKLHDTVRIAEELEQAGADMIEIGIPFSDPVADGPVIQYSNKRALENGITLGTIFRQVEEIRKTVQLPVLLMGYCNPILQFGMDRFVAECMQVGVDGVILPDLPPDVYAATYQHLFEGSRIKISFLITPGTPDDRIRFLDGLSTGFVYAVSASSTTGIKSSFSPDQLDYFLRLKILQLKNPFLIGFGVSNAATFGLACRYAAGAIVGSAFIKALEENTCRIAQFITELRAETKNPGR